MREAFASRTTAEWTEFLAGQPEIIYERIQNYDELLLDPQVSANGYLVDVDVPKFGTARRRDQRGPPQRHARRRACAGRRRCSASTPPR